MRHKHAFLPESPRKRGSERVCGASTSQKVGKKRTIVDTQKSTYKPPPEPEEEGE
eukprot:NODE_11558_length_302_cov_15.667984_g10645_i0.p3 GENE.NODE_11558_length_302_cov_15.667984_g10645_i0~~NODE_11558_length_302_cov_15.667984_g10645_i0.p3  ORF type:complete len:55 (-),score=6.15 NODE_11558_length_302_cov_15.667984_g10645_i0:129-293(-)